MVKDAEFCSVFSIGELIFKIQNKFLEAVITEFLKIPVCTNKIFDKIIFLVADSS